MSLVTESGREQLETARSAPDPEPIREDNTDTNCVHCGQTICKQESTSGKYRTSDNLVTICFRMLGCRSGLAGCWAGLGWAGGARQAGGQSRTVHISCRLSPVQ